MADAQECNDIARKRRIEVMYPATCDECESNYISIAKLRTRFRIEDMHKNRGDDEESRVMRGLFFAVAMSGGPYRFDCPRAGRDRHCHARLLWNGSFAPGLQRGFYRRSADLAVELTEAISRIEGIYDPMRLESIGHVSKWTVRAGRHR